MEEVEVDCDGGGRDVGVVGGWLERQDSLTSYHNQ